MAWRGEAGLGSARQGNRNGRRYVGFNSSPDSSLKRGAGRGLARPGTARLGVARPGVARLGSAGLGKGLRVAHSLVRVQGAIIPERGARPGEAGLGAAGRGMAWQGKVRLFQ